MTPGRAVRFGILCDPRNGTRLQEWQARCLRCLLALGYAEPTLVIRKHVPPELPGPPGRGLWSRLLRPDRLWLRYCRKVIDARCLATPLVEMADVLAKLPALDCRVMRRGKYSEYFSDDDVRAIREHNLDFIIRFAPGIIRGDILTAARYGIWSYHHDDLEKYRGGPAGFWEIYTGDPVTGVTLQRLTDRLDAGIVLRRGYFPTVDHSYVSNRQAALLKSVEWPAHVCRDVSLGNTGYLDAPASKTCAPIFRAPGNWQWLVFAVRQAGNRVRMRLRSLFCHEQWNVGVVRTPIDAFLAGTSRPTVHWAPRRGRTQFLADPFAMRHTGVTTILAEDFDYRTKKGVISAFGIRDDGTFTKPRPVLEFPVHASYPFLFEHEGSVYCVPELSGLREVGLYKADRFPDAWKKVATLVEGFPGVDATLFHHEGRWWLFCTSGDDGTCLNLYVFHSRDLFGPWQAHARNPVKTDARSARPAGTPFVRDGRLYRPSQDCSTTYGGAIAMNEVTRLTPDEFAENTVAVVRPDRKGPYSWGLHTICAAGDVTIIDAKRKAFVWEEFKAAALLLAAETRQSLYWTAMRTRNFLRFRWLLRRVRPWAPALRPL